MVVLPGGSFRALAWDVDGLETAQWLSDRGITAFLLKYRVRPPLKGESFGESLEDFARATKTRRAIAVADGEEAIRFIRSHAQQYSVAPNRVGIIGFSAGAMATVEVALAKEASVRPDFAVPMYGAALTSELPSSERAAVVHRRSARRSAVAAHQQCRDFPAMDHRRAAGRTPYLRKRGPWVWLSPPRLAGRRLACIFRAMVSFARLLSGPAGSRGPQKR